MKRYQASKLLWLTVLFLIISAFAFMTYLIYVMPQSLADPLVLKTPEKLRSGQCLKLQVDKSMLLPADDVDEEFVTLTKSYRLLPLQTWEGVDAKLGVFEKETLAFAEKLKDGDGGELWLTARVRKSKVLGLMLLETNQKEFAFLLYLGIAMLAAAAISFVTVGGIQKVFVRPFEDSATYRECYFGKIYNLEERLEKEEKNLEIYLKQQRESHKSCLVGAGLILGGILCIVFGFNFFLGLLQGPGMTIGTFAIIAGIKWIWAGFLNSGLTLAYRLSDLFMLRTASVRIDETAKLITAIKHGIREKEKRIVG